MTFPQPLPRENNLMKPDELLTRYAAGERDFRGVVIFDNYLSEAVLTGADFAGANLRWTFMREAKFQGANFDGADLAWVSAAGADFAGASFRGTRLEGAHCYHANLRGADLTNANIARAHFSSTLLDGTPAFDGSTIWPEDPELFDGATIDHVPFREWKATLEAVGPNPAPAVREAWKAMAAVEAARAAALQPPADRPPASR